MKADLYYQTNDQRQRATWMQFLKPLIIRKERFYRQDKGRGWVIFFTLTSFLSADKWIATSTRPCRHRPWELYTLGLNGQSFPGALSDRGSIWSYPPLPLPITAWSKPYLTTDQSLYTWLTILCLQVDTLQFWHPYQTLDPAAQSHNLHSPLNVRSPWSEHAYGKITVTQQSRNSAGWYLLCHRLQGHSIGPL